MGGGTTTVTEPVWPLTEETSAKGLKSMCVERGLVAGKKEVCIATLRRWQIIKDDQEGMVGKLKAEGFVPPTEENGIMMIAEAAGTAGGEDEDDEDDEDFTAEVADRRGGLPRILVAGTDGRAAADLLLPYMLKYKAEHLGLAVQGDSLQQYAFLASYVIYEVEQSGDSYVSQDQLNTAILVDNFPVGFTRQSPSGTRAPPWTAADGLRLIAVMVSDEATVPRDQYCGSLNRRELDSGRRNDDIWTDIARIFNNPGFKPVHKAPDDTLVGQISLNFRLRRDGEKLKEKFAEIKRDYTSPHRNFTKEKTGEHDAELRRFFDFLPENKGLMTRQIIMYTHLVFFDTELVDMVTKSLPGGGAGASTDGVRLNVTDPGDRNGSGNRKRSAVDDLDRLAGRFMAPTDTDKQIGTALTSLAGSAAQDAVMKQLEFYAMLDSRGLLSADQKAVYQRPLMTQMQNTEKQLATQAPRRPPPLGPRTDNQAPPPTPQAPDGTDRAT